MEEHKKQQRDIPESKRRKGDEVEAAAHSIQDRTSGDGNNRILPLAWAVCETESKDTYAWFAQQCYDAGLGRYLNGKSVVFSASTQTNVETWKQQNKCQDSSIKLLSAYST